MPFTICFSGRVKVAQEVFWNNINFFTFQEIIYYYWEITGENWSCFQSSPITRIFLKLGSSGAVFDSSVPKSSAVIATFRFPVLLSDWASAAPSEPTAKCTLHGLRVRLLSLALFHNLQNAFYFRCGLSAGKRIPGSIPLCRSATIPGQFPPTWKYGRH